LRFKFIPYLAILLILFLGMAGATMPNPTYNFGPQSGIKVQALEVVHDAQVKGNLYCNGTTVVNGAITSDTTIDWFIGNYRMLGAGCRVGSVG